MAYEQDDPQFSSVIKILKGLPRIDASSSFEMDLRRRLYTEGTGNKLWYRKFLIPSRIIPSAALIAAALIIFFFLNIQSPQSEDPLFVKPQLREEILSAKSQSDETVVSNAPAKKDLPAEASLGGVNEMRITSNVGYIAKSGLNFRQVNLSEAEKDKIQKLKDKFKDWFNPNK